jgi:hypothetical protein
MTTTETMDGPLDANRGSSTATNSAEDMISRQKWIVIGCVLFYCVLAVAVFWPALPWNDARLPSYPSGSPSFGDPAQMTWYLEWFSYAIRHGLNPFFTRILDYPTGVNLASNTSVPLLGLLGMPVTLTLGPVAAFNVLLRLAFCSSAASMFLVLRSWCRWPAAFLGGLVYGFGPYMVTHGQSHLNLVFVPLPPVMVWCLYELLVTKRRNPVRMGLLLGALAAAQALIEPELLAMLAVVIVIFLVGFALYTHHDLRGRFGNLLKAIAPASLVFLLLTGFMIWSLLRGQGHVVGTPLPIANLQEYHADLMGLIYPTDQLITPVKLAVAAFAYVGENVSENSTYLGLPIVVLVAIFAVRWRRNRVILTSALLALIGFIFSLGSSLYINNRPTGIAMPEAIFTHLPVLDSIIPARFSFVVALFAVIAVTVGGDQYAESLASRKKTSPINLVDVAGVLSLLFALLLVVPRVPFLTGPPTWPKDTVSTLKVIPSGAVTLTYPFTLSQFTEAMSWQAESGMRFRLIGGYATVQGSKHAGQQYQTLLKPAFVQEYLTKAQGTYSWIPFYPPPKATVDPVKALCQFIAKYRVGAVVYWHDGAHPVRVKNLFLEALGTPVKSTEDRKVLVWLPKGNRCP